MTIFSTGKNGITIPLNLAAEGSAFIIFQKRKIANYHPTEIINSASLIYTNKGIVSIISKNSSLNEVAINNPWEVRFDHIGNTPVIDTMKKLIPLNKSSDSSVKYFSGKATYYNTFEITANDFEKQRVLLLSLGNVKEIADVYLNGIKLGQYWHSSHVIAIDNELKVGTNHLVIEVANSINNRLIGDAGKPLKCRTMRSNITRLPNAWMNSFSEASLIDAGLIGPITFTWAIPVK